MQVNVLICDPYPIRGKPEGSVYENVSRNRQNFDLKNEILILGETYRQKRLTSRLNVVRLLKQISAEAKDLNSRIFEWIVKKMKKWKNKSQISLFYASHNVKFVNFIVNIIASLYHSYFYQNCNKRSFVTKYCLMITFIIVARVNIKPLKVDKYVLKIIVIRLIIWLYTMISSSEMLSLTIYLDMLRQNVESNPGMKISNDTLTVITYNTNRLGDKTKLRRLLTKVEPIVSKVGIILLQETHLKETSYLSLFWKFNFVSNCTKTNLAGVIILFNKEYESLDSFSSTVNRGPASSASGSGMRSSGKGVKRPGDGFESSKSKK